MSIRLVVPDLSHADVVKQWRSSTRRISQVVERIKAMDPDALARLRQVGEGAVDIFFSTPTGTIYLQRILGTLGQTGEGVVKAYSLSEAFGTVEATADVLDLGESVDLLWRGALPPAAGYVMIDTPPGSVIRQLYRDMASESREHSGPTGIARSLLDQEVMQVSQNRTGEDSTEAGSSSSASAQSVAITGRMIATMGALGLAPEPTSPAMQKYDFVRVSAQGSWIRVDGLGGSLFTPRPGGLARVP